MISSFRQTIPAVLANAEKARAAGADLVIAIVHADKPTGAALMNSHAVDFILSGHNHDLHIDFDGRTALMESEQDANYVTIADIEVTQNRGQADRSSSWWPNFRVIDTAKVVSDPAMLAKVQMYSAGLNRLFDVEIATLAAALDSRPGALRSGECAIGDLVADALRSAAAAEVAIINGGSIRGNRIYAAGTRLTKRDILDELPFGNKTMATKVSGTADFGGAREWVFSNRAPNGTVSTSVRLGRLCQSGFTSGGAREDGPGQRRGSQPWPRVQDSDQ